MIYDFEKFAQEGRHFLNALADDMGYPEDKPRAARVLRAVIHCLRDELTIEESVQLMAQLPMFLKAIYVDQWRAHPKKSKARHLKDFYQRIMDYDKIATAKDFQSYEEVEVAVSVVFLQLRPFISKGEWEDIRAVLPKELKSIVDVVFILE